MRRTWLVLDGNYLCWRTFFTTGRLANGVTFGLLRDVQYLTEQHATPHVVFTFDHGKGIRESISPTYKSTRRAKVLTEDEAEQIAEMRRQVEEIKSTTLKECGFKNVFYQTGYEADDVCAAVVEHLPDDDQCVVVSADRDLLQLIDARVSVWDPHRKIATTIDGFREYWQIEPTHWRQVKAIAGCPTDDVRGVPGVGEITAAKFLRNEMGPGNAKWEAIHAFLNTPQYEINLRLVTLPLPGVNDFELSDATVSQRDWNKVAARFGMKSLKDKQPGHKGTGFGIRPKV